MYNDLHTFDFEKCEFLWRSTINKRKNCFLTKKFFSSVFPLFKSISSHKWNFTKNSSRGSILHTLHRYQWGCHLLVRFGAGGLSGLLFTWSPILLFRISHFVKCTATIILKNYTTIYRLDGRHPRPSQLEKVTDRFRWARMNTRNSYEYQIFLKRDKIRLKIN